MSGPRGHPGLKMEVARGFGRQVSKEKKASQTQKTRDCSFNNRLAAIFY